MPRPLKETAIGPRVGPRFAQALIPGQEELGRGLAASYDQTDRAGRLPIEDRDLVDAAVASESDRRSDLDLTPAKKLDGIIRLNGHRVLKDAEICKILHIDEGQFYQFWLGIYTMSQEQLEVIDGLYAVSAVAYHESNGDWRKARERLTKKSPRLIKDPSDPLSPERSMIEAITDGDMEKAISVMDYLVGDFNPDVTAKDS